MKQIVKQFITTRQALMAEGARAGQYAIYRHGGRGPWGGWYEDAVTGVYITAQDTPGRLDSNECLAVCEQATNDRLAKAGYREIDPEFLKDRGWRHIPGKGWTK